jgi:hypothetical protein
VPLGNIVPFLDWITRDNPPYRDARPVESFIEELGEKPYAWPSTPYDSSYQPRSEVRYAEIGGSNPVAIWYQRTYGTEMVDLVAVRWVNEPNVLISLDDG